MKVGLVLALFACASCAHVTPFPERTMVARRSYLAEKPVAITGQLQHVREGVWCADDDAFSLPVIAYPDGPVDIVDQYEARVITNTLDMFDVHGSVLHVIRTIIRDDWTEQDAERRYERSAHFWDGEPLITNEWVRQTGRKELQQLNRAPSYDGRKDATMLTYMQGTSVGYYKPDACRVDRHFVARGYYFQVVAVAYKIGPDRDLCEVASEMAAWTSENIHVGGGCGPRLTVRE